MRTLRLQLGESGYIFKVCEACGDIADTRDWYRCAYLTADSFKG